MRLFRICIPSTQSCYFQVKECANKKSTQKSTKHPVSLMCTGKPKAFSASFARISIDKTTLFARWFITAHSGVFAIFVENKSTSLIRIYIYLENITDAPPRHPHESCWWWICLLNYIFFAFHLAAPTSIWFGQGILYFTMVVVCCAVLTMGFLMHFAIWEWVAILNVRIYLRVYTVCDI